MDRRAFIGGLTLGALATRHVARAQPARKVCSRINLKAAKFIGLTIPQSVVLRADEVLQ